MVSSKKVLIVDDEPLILRSLSRSIKRLDIEVKAVDRAADALSEVHSSFYNLIFLDIILPDGYGLDIIKEIKMVSPDTKVVIMSASLLTDEMEKIIEEYAHCFMGKPFDLLQVKTILNDTLQLEAMEGEEREEAADLGSKERLSRRKRCKGSIAVEIAPSAGEEVTPEEIDLVIVDMSEGGAGLSSPSPLSPGTTLLFKGTLKGKKGVVKWCERSGKEFRIGIEFL